jgi:hypothetical protein
MMGRDNNRLKDKVLSTTMRKPDFNRDYGIGKTSEEKSLPDIKQIFYKDLELDENQFSHFDYISDKIKVELKTRDDIKFVDGKFIHPSGELESLYFDKVKLLNAIKENKYRIQFLEEEPLRFFICWKCSGEYFYWEILFKENGWLKNGNDYFIEYQNRDRGHGYIHPTPVINVKVENIKKAEFTSL